MTKVIIIIVSNHLTEITGQSSTCFCIHVHGSTCISFMHGSFKIFFISFYLSLSPSLPPSLPLSLPLPSISGTGQYLLTGTEDGSVELHRLSDPYSLAGLKVEGHDVWTGYT